MDVDPVSAGARVDSEDTAHVVFRFTEAGQVHLRPFNATALEVNVVAPTDVTAIEFKPPGGSGDPADIKMDSRGWTWLSGTTSDGTSVVGLAGIANVTSQTIAVCNVEPEIVLGDGVYRINPVGVGDCTIRAEHNGLTAEVTHKVVE